AGAAAPGGAPGGARATRRGSLRDLGRATARQRLRGHQGRMTRSGPRRPAPVQRTRAGVVARRLLGQHFLVDAGVGHATVEAIGPRPGDVLVEIGPGPGALTDAL